MPNSDGDKCTTIGFFCALFHIAILRMYEGERAKQPMQFTAIQLASPVLLTALATACSGGGSTNAAEGPDASTAIEPFRIVLSHTLDAEERLESGVRFSDGSLLGPDDADLFMNQARVISLASKGAESLCEKGVFDSIDDIPTTVDECPANTSGAWNARIYLSASTNHTTSESNRIGVGLLAWNTNHTALYKLLVVGDSYDFEGVSTVTFDYERVDTSELEEPQFRCR